MKKTIIEEYDSNGKLVKKTTIEEDSVNYNGMYNPYSPYNPIAKPTITNVSTTGVVDCLDKSIISTASGPTKATLKENKMEVLKIKKLHPDAHVPTRAHDTDAGMDLYALPVEYTDEEKRDIKTNWPQKRCYNRQRHLIFFGLRLILIGNRHLQKASIFFRTKL